MTISGRTIAKNASVLMISQVITWGLTFLVTIFLSRYLGPQGVGQLQLAASLWSIVGVIAALGMDTLLTKEVARSPSRMSELIGTTLVLRTMIYMFGALGMAAYVQMAGYPAQTVSVIWITGLAGLIGHLKDTYDSSLKGLERMEYTSLAVIASIALLTFLRIPMLLFGYGVIPIAVVAIIANIASFGVLFYFSQKFYLCKLTVNWHLVHSVLAASLPYFLVSVGIVLYHQVDTVIISLLADEKTIGWYGAAAQLYGTLLFIPSVFVTALFPALSRAYTGSREASQRLAQKSMNLLILISVPVGLGIAVIANQLVVLLFGAAFANSGPVLAIRGILLILTYVNMLLGFLLISMDRQKAWAVAMLIATLATIPLDLILVPWTVKNFGNGALGGAISFAFTEVGITTAGFILLPSGTFGWENMKVAVRMILAGGVMVGATWFVRNAFILIPITVGAVTYIGMIATLHAVPKEDLDFLVRIGASFFQRLRSHHARAVEVKG